MALSKSQWRHAYVDESYTPPKNGAPIYVLAAVILVGDDAAARRAIRQHVAPDTDFHTTELAKDNRHADIEAMVAWGQTHGGMSVVVVQAPFVRSVEASRQSCLRVLLVELAARGVSQVVIDSRRHPFGRDPKALDRLDEHTVQQLRAAGTVPRGVTIRHYSDSAEPLLWLADATAWTIRRNLALGEAQWEHVTKAADVLHLDADDRERPQ